MNYMKTLYSRIIIMFSLSYSLLFSQSIVAQESYDSRFTPPEIGLPENMPYFKSLIWGKEGTFRKLNIGGGNTGGGSGDSGYNYNSGTKTITIDTSKIYQNLQNPGNGIALSSSNTFDSRGIIVLRISEGIVRALSRNCTHAGFVVNYDSSNNTLPCSQQGGGHGSVFNSNGNAISGPASGSLTSYNASVSGSIITITQN